MASEHTLNFSDSAFDQDVLNSDVPVLVDFWAPWCGPCKAMTPTVDAVATEYAGKLKVGKLNTDDNPNLRTASGIRFAESPRCCCSRAVRSLTSASAPWVNPTC